MHACTSAPHARAPLLSLLLLLPSSFDDALQKFALASHSKRVMKQALISYVSKHVPLDEYLASVDYFIHAIHDGLRYWRQIGDDAYPRGWRRLRVSGARARVRVCVCVCVCACVSARARACVRVSRVRE